MNPTIPTLVLAALFVGACSSSSSEEPTRASLSLLCDEGGTDDAPASDSAAPGKPCKSDDECVAVPKDPCCEGGLREAMTSLEAAVLPAPNCPVQRGRCDVLGPQESVPECSHLTFRCEMVPIDQIACGGFIFNPHHCPDGWYCDYYTHVPDVAGRCERGRAAY